MGMTPKEIAAWAVGLTAVGGAGTAAAMAAAAEDDDVDLGHEYERPSSK